MRLLNRFLLPLCAVVLISACDSKDQLSTLTLNDRGQPTFELALPDSIRSSQAVDFDRTGAEINTSAGLVVMQRDDAGNFTGSIPVAQGSSFSYTLSIFEIVGNDKIIYATYSDEFIQVVNSDVDVVLNLNNYIYPDDDSDGASNLVERNAGSNPTSSASTPSNPDGNPPTTTQPGTLQFNATTYDAAEADGTLTITVTRLGGSDGRVSAQYNLRTETAFVGTDVEANAGQLIWQDGDAAPQEITVVLNEDDDNDGSQTFTAHLFAATGGADISNGFARVTLTDSTAPAQRGTLRVASTSVTIAEDAARVSLEVERVNGSDGLVTVDYVTTEGSATNDDFGAIEEPRTLRWADGEDGSRTISISIRDDNEVEGAERFTINLSNSLGGAILAAATTTVTISDTTPLPVPGAISLVDDTYSVAEGQSVNIAVARLTGNDGPVSVQYQVNTGTATEADIEISSGQLDWASGENGQKTINVSALSDALEEGNETFSVTLSDVTGGATIATASVPVTVIDATVIRSGVIGFASAATSLDEGGSTDIRVLRGNGSAGVVSVTVTSATTPGFSITPASLEWADGDTEAKTISLTAIANDIIGDSNTVTVSLGNPTGDATLDVAELTVTINDTSVATGYVPRETDGEWEVCVAPYSPSSSSGFALQLSANEGRVVRCIKTCPENIELDPDFEGWGWNQADQHSCTPSTDAPGTYSKVPIYTPGREAININLNAQAFVGDANSIWACTREERINAGFSYVNTSGITIWYQFATDGTYFYSSSPTPIQPATLLGPAVWSAQGRTLELGHLDTGYRNVLFFPGNNTFHVHPTTDDRLVCMRQTRIELPSQLQADQSSLR